MGLIDEVNEFIMTPLLALKNSVIPFLPKVPTNDP